MSAARGREPEPTFDQLYTRLEEITDRLDGGDLSLEQAVALYEEGMQLAKRCQELLGGVEQRIEQLRQAYEDSEQPA
ncbi:MAG: exodeoxyribonuclease VII small subunit [Dehalococcoidia bacterium]|nr:exodeoxyribonuclease VII small subunit [Dehalococcoidia bacterium]